MSHGENLFSRYSRFDQQKNLALVAEQASVLGRFMQGTSARVLVLASIRGPEWLLSWFLGAAYSFYLTFAALILIPGSFAFLAGAATDAHVYDFLGLILYYAFLLVLLYVFPRYAWLQLIGISDDIDKLFVSDLDRRNFIAYIALRLRFWPQALWGVLCVVCGVVTISLLRPYLSRLPVNDLSLYIFAAILVWFEANVVYWCWFVPQIVRQLNHAPSLRLSVLAPAYTPGIIALSRLLGTSSLLVSFGVLSVVIPLLGYVFYFGSKDALIVLSVISSLGMLIASFVGLAPQYWLTLATRRHKEQSLDSIIRRIDGYGVDIPGLTNEDAKERTGALIQLHKQIQQAETLAIKIENIIKYLAAFLSALSPITAVLLKEYFR